MGKKKSGESHLERHASGKGYKRVIKGQSSHILGSGEVVEHPTMVINLLCIRFFFFPAS